MNTKTKSRFYEHENKKLFFMNMKTKIRFL